MADYNNSIIGKKLPKFEAQTTNGSITLPDDSLGNWVILYSYIGDFLPSDASDILALDAALAKFNAHDAKVYAMSPDSVATHIAWNFALRNYKRDGKNIGIELISDRALDISKMLNTSTADSDMNLNEKTVFIIDKDGVVRSRHNYSHSTGINVTDIERELLALQTAQHQNAQTPVNWTPGEDVLEHPPKTIDSAGNNIQFKEAQGGRCIDWYICYRADNGKRTEKQITP